MRPDLLEKVRLRCPVCRAGALALHAPVSDGHGAIRHAILRCANPECAAASPIIDGVPILVEDWVEYARSERWMILRRHDLPAGITAMLDAPLGDDHAERIRRRHLESFRLGQFGRFSPELAELGRPFAEFLETALNHYTAPPRERPALALDAGCATGGYTQMLARYVDCAIGIDLHFERLRAALELCSHPPSAGFLVANAEAPPFEPGSFDIVLALNLIDSTASPRRLLSSLNHLLRPGGLLVLTTPFEYSTTHAAPGEWITGPELSSLLSAAFDILEDRERLPWVVPVTDRRSDVFFVRALVARKQASHNWGQ
jgi:SAM-dependent methyltransferase/uncharacterized protein YbaR (Trm112 family)